jgi:DMSO/TMAO reductase YedYZ molybdopterin-dependent catalytic subunit
MTEERKIVTQALENSETPLDDIRSWVTPNRLFFVRNHFAVPEIVLRDWRLTIGGCVERPLELTWEQLTAWPQRSVFVTMECAGNGRSFLDTHQHGVQWGAGAIGHAEWTGVPLRLLLHKAGLKPQALEVLFEGHDAGTEPDHPQTMQFARSVPVAKALDPDTILAVRMNGELLDPLHGYPVRLVVPGWYGVASVKWLKRIEVIDYAFRGYYQSTKYTVKQRGPGGVETVVIGPMKVKSKIIRPRPGEIFGIGTNRLFGVAWGGPEAIGRVEVSTDGGRTWSEADLMRPRATYSWTMWEYLWEVGRPGTYTIQARATTTAGQTQAATHDPQYGGYLIHHHRPHEVRVEATRRVEDRRSNADLLLYDMNAFAEENRRFPLDVEMLFSGREGI